MARPRFHILVTAPLAWAAARRWGPVAAVGAVVGGVLIDGDHLVDYAWTRVTGERSHYFAPLHGWELPLVGAAVAAWAWRQARYASPLPDSWVPRQSPLVGALDVEGLRLVAGASAGLALGIFVHLVHDLVSNRPQHVGAYSLLFRLARGFERAAVGWEQHPDFHGWSHLPWHRWI